MGSFFASCSVTGTTIVDNMDACIQLLIPTGFNEGMDKGLQINEEGGLVPFGFVIRGYYNDYGRLGGIKMDDNVKKIEEFFGISIEDVMVVCGRDGWDHEIFEFAKSQEERDDLISKIKNLEILKTMNMTFIHEKIYDFMCEGWDKLPTDKSQLTKYDWMGERFIECWENIEHLTMKEEDREKVLKTIMEKKRIDHPEWDEKTLRMISEMEINRGYVSLEYRHTYLGRYMQGKDFIALMQCRTEDFGDDMKKQYMFLRNLQHRTNNGLVLSQYGTQENNFKYTKKLNKKLDEIMDDGIGMYDYDLSDEELAEMTMEERQNTINGLLQKDYDREDVIEIIKELNGSVNENKLNKILDERSKEETEKLQKN